MPINISGFSSNPIIGGIGEKLTIYGSGFGNQGVGDFVSFNQNHLSTYLTPSEAIKLNYLGWTDTQIIVEMPPAYSGEIIVNVNGRNYYSKDILHVSASLDNRDCNKEKYFLVNKNGSGGETWQMDSSYHNNPIIKKAIEDVFEKLREQTGVNFKLSNTVSNQAPSCNSSINIIAPDSNIPSGGYTYYNWGYCPNYGNKINHLLAWNIGMSTKETWHYGLGKAPSGHAKFKYVLMHELGHTVGLGDVSNSEYGQTMNSCVSNPWNSMDEYSNEEVKAMTHFVEESKKQSFNDCGLTQLLPFSDYKDLY